MTGPTCTDPLLKRPSFSQWVRRCQRAVSPGGQPEPRGIEGRKRHGSDLPGPSHPFGQDVCRPELPSGTRWTRESEYDASERRIGSTDAE